MPGMEYLVFAIILSTLWPGSWPPSPGFAPWAILICISSAFTRYSVVTPNRPLATCLMALLVLSPSSRGLNLSGSSPPSPVLLLPPIRFIAMAIVSWASRLIDPYDIAPVTKRFMIFSAGSTSSRGIGFFLILSNPLINPGWAVSLFTRLLYSLNFERSPVLVLNCRRAIVSGFQAWCSPCFLYE